MNINDLVCQFEPIDKDIFLYELARSYYIRCESYDKTVCSHETLEGYMPTTYKEMGLSNINARAVLNDCIHELIRRGYSYEEWKQVKNRYLYSHQYLSDIQDL